LGAVSKSLSNVVEFGPTSSNPPAQLEATFGESQAHFLQPTSYCNFGFLNLMRRTIIF